MFIYLFPLPISTYSFYPRHCFPSQLADHFCCIFPFNAWTSSSHSSFYSHFHETLLSSDIRNACSNHFICLCSNTSGNALLNVSSSPILSFLVVSLFSRNSCQIFYYDCCLFIAVFN